ncbi:hypothetical protein EUAN_08780 [Andreesenia angusta]|uniref:Uncharacterized protein n=1 Tax=Andreesenia angusta TaxID=39480 RepID=A0A1S1V9A7_9FIRM|nr:hypothetical protein [Andreesenia angusta]OHW63094.1 hypothetical protein EUAN_08780 [Andreesenia angusta]
MIEVSLHSLRIYGETKLTKPKELKGIKSSFSADYIPKKCRCPIFLVGDDVWINHKDYFSGSMKVPREEFGAPLDYMANKYAGKNKGKKFIYGDAWGSIVLRNEAWIKAEHLVKRAQDGVSMLKLRDDFLKQLEIINGFEEYELFSSDMSRFIERVINEIKRRA